MVYLLCDFKILLTVFSDTPLPGCMYFPVSVWLAVVAFNCLIDATPLPEDRAKTPKEVQKINKWLGVDKNSDILKDILKVADAFIKIQENKQKIEGNN